MRIAYIHEFFIKNVDSYRKENIDFLKAEKEILSLSKKEIDEYLNNRFNFKDYVFLFTLFAAIYKVWDMEKEFYRIPLINSPQITLAIIVVSLSIVCLLDYKRVHKLIKNKQDIEIMISGIDYCIENNLYSEHPSNIEPTEAEQEQAE